MDGRIDRQAAADILSISQRTLDRHVKNKRLYSRKVNGRIWLDEEEVRMFKKAREQGVLEDSTRQHQGLETGENHGIINIDTSRHDVDKVDTGSSLTETQEKVLSLLGKQVLHNDKIEENVVIRPLHIAQNTAPSMTPYAPQNSSSQFAYYYSEGIYQKLYEELKEEHRLNQKRIESANYKVGQLEAQIESMIPMLEYRKQKEQFRKLESGLKVQIEKREIQLKKARRLVQSEQLNKWIFAILAISLIVLQPIIWLMSK
ncbi:MAG: hypothetical protein U1D98_04550 [Candidatus Gracilibacteria bacterium]|nr:hypothetical protein [Candidatus Gracilibacteria bacterium]